MEKSQETSAENTKKTVSHRRKWLTLEEKLKIIHLHENDGKSSTRIAKEQGMNESSVRLILKRKEFYKSMGTSTPFHRYKSFSRYRILLLDKVEQRLVTWIEEKNRHRIQLTETEIQKKALELFNELKSPGETEKFSASRGWLYGFKNRINLQNCIIPTEKPAPDQEAAVKFQSEFTKIMEDGGYSPYQIFTIEEMGLYWKKIPTQNFLLEGEKSLQGHKPFKDCLTLLLGSNATGDVKLKPMLVYRSETPSALKDCEKNLLPVFWRSNKKAWLTKELLEEYFNNYFCPSVEKYCKEHGLDFKVILILDSTSSHQITSSNDKIKIVFLPQNTETLLQPLGLSVFPIFRANYIRQIFVQAVTEINPDTNFKDFWLNYNIKFAINNIFQSWCDTKPENLAAGWYRILPDIKEKNLEPELSYIVQEIVNMGQYLGLKTIDSQSVLSCINSKVKDLELATPGFEEVICKEETSDMYEDEDGECNELSYTEPELVMPEFEEVLCKEETSNLYKNLDEDYGIQKLSSTELKKILQNIDAACEIIAATDSDVERSIKVRQMLQNGIKPYRDLYIEKTKQKFKYDSFDI